MEEVLKKKLGTSIIGQGQFYVLKYFNLTEKFKKENKELKKEIDLLKEEINEIKSKKQHKK